MTTKTHPWTFLDPHCGQPALHARTIPRLTSSIVDMVDFGELEHLDGRPVALVARAFLCGSCRGQLLDPLVLAAMTVESNWRRREPPIAPTAPHNVDVPPPPAPAAASLQMLEVRTLDGQTARLPVGDLGTYLPGEVDACELTSAGWELVPA